MPDPGSDALAPSPNVETHPLAPETPHSLEIDVDSQSGRRSSAAAQAALNRRRTRQLGTAAIVVWVLAACVFALAFTRHPRHAATVAKRGIAPPAHVAMHSAPTILAKAAEEQVASPPPAAEPGEATPPPREGAPPSEAAPPPGEATPPPSKAHSEQGRGQIALPASAAGHRIYVDGHVVGDGPAPVDVSCGDHKLRVGSKGQWRAVHVPCGGVLSID
ncbi:MAG TPA: hypothetical protein VLM85_34160 [Polyangiaceae bacterium]|nr:hypothetical protein [Polyangiaceae bacterium]